MALALVLALPRGQPQPPERPPSFLGKTRAGPGSPRGRRGDLLWTAGHWGSLRSAGRQERLEGEERDHRAGSSLWPQPVGTCAGDAGASRVDLLHGPRWLRGATVVLT